MVSYKDIINNNTSLKQSGSGATAVFVGATDGIGLGALKSFTKNTDSPTIYIVGRSTTRLETLINSLKPTNPTATFHSIYAADLTLISSAASAAQEIAKSASRIDLLIMSPGYLSFSRDESPEGLDRVQAIRFYSRMRILETLAPLLRKSPSPRIVNVLAGGQEGQMWKDDLLLKDHYNIGNAATASASMMTMYLEEFARQPENANMVLIHLYPGLVGGTGIKFTGINFVFQFLLDWVAAPLMRLVGYTADEAGERVIFAATNGRYRRLAQGQSAEGTLLQKGVDGRVGSGVYLVSGDTSTVTENKTLKQLRADGMAKVVYDHVHDVFAAVAAQ